MKVRVGGRRLGFPSPALTVACVALAVALSGAGYAAVALPRASVGTPQLKRGAVTSPKVRNHSLKTVDFAPKVLPPSNVYYATAPTSFTTVTAVIPTMTNTLVRDLSLQAGTYELDANVLVENLGAAIQANARCFIVAPVSISGGWDGYHQPLEPNAGTNTERLTFRLGGLVTLTAPGTVRVECNKQAAGESIGAIANIFARKIARYTAG